MLIVLGSMDAFPKDECQSENVTISKEEELSSSTEIYVVDDGAASRAE